ncbi:MAG: winged helix DNA-binding domain-containing protein [Gammaproteobacteria bacterium]|nr:winged helix DNA-binding domain-containing protein [Gammaproteobacteria bacterium]MDE0366278.1 winged helix DNA-binding domain-containing protein [Gammaproteobacteria bacterium]
MRPDRRKLTPSTALRRIALAHQGLIGRRRLGRGLDGVRKTLDRLGYVQIDTISVVARAHHHTFWSRVSGYRDDLINRLIRRGEAFEYWSHAAAYLPMRHYRFSLPAMRAFKNGEERWMRSQEPKLMRSVLDRIRHEGPLRARDFVDSPRGSPGWWDWKPAKGALEQLFMQGDLMCVRRDGFEKVYDLTERVLPRDAVTSEPSVEGHAAHLVDATLRAHGLAAPRAFTYGICLGNRNAPTRAAVKDLLRRAVGDGTLTTAMASDGRVFYGRPEALAERPRKPPPVVRILSPFDNSIIQRDRAHGLFEFDFQLECYVTEAKRRWGYFCLPILLGDTFVGRMDCKAHRTSGVFEIRHLHLEKPVGEAFDPAFSAAIRDYAVYNGCDGVEVSRVSPADQRRRIVRALAHPP